MHQYIKFILFWTDTSHVSDGLSIHHLEFETVHTATKQILLYVQSQTPGDHPKHVECQSKIK